MSEYVPTTDEVRLTYAAGDIGSGKPGDIVFFGVESERRFDRWLAAQQPSREAVASKISLHKMGQCSAPGHTGRERWYVCEGCGHETARREQWNPADADLHVADVVLRLMGASDE